MTDEQRGKLHAFLQDAPKRTQDIQTVAIEICESKYDRIALSVIDTPGLDFQPGRELSLERQVSSIVRYLDAQFADTLNEVRPCRCLRPPPALPPLSLFGTGSP